MANFVQPPCDEAVIRSRAAASPCAKSFAPWILAATILGSSMAFIDGTVVNVALPALQANLNATVVDVQWVVEAYSLFLSALLLVGGSLGDHYGRRRIFVIGVTLFSLASAWCGLATSIGQLILARAVQGAGGALLVPEVSPSSAHRSAIKIAVAPSGHGLASLRSPRRSVPSSVDG